MSTRRSQGRVCLGGTLNGKIVAYRGEAITVPIREPAPTCIPFAPDQSEKVLIPTEDYVAGYRCWGEGENTRCVYYYALSTLPQDEVTLLAETYL